MGISAKVGERTYEFEFFSDLARARDIYTKFTGGQNEFESAMESAGIEFTLELLECGV